MLQKKAKAMFSVSRKILEKVVSSNAVESNKRQECLMEWVKKNSTECC